MKEMNGFYASAKIFTTNNEATSIDSYAIAQLQMLCDNETAKDCRIRVMPDVHPGKVGIIGLTMTVGKQLMSNLTGIDLGCGISLAKVKGKVKEFQKLDSVIRERMKGIYSPSINKDTLDEAPFAYRDIKEIEDAVKETVKIDRIIKPIYNFKANGK